MAYFKDRVSKNPRRKKLEVLDITLDAGGNVKTITADVYRHEGEVSEEGTALNAENLNIFFKLIENIVKENYFKADSLSALWSQKDGTYNQSKFRISFKSPDFKFYAKLKCDYPYLAGFIEEKSDYVDVTIKEMPDLNQMKGTTPNEYKFEIEFYHEPTLVKYFTTLTGTIRYYFKTEIPID